MAITAELFDGTKLEFPEGTDQSIIDATARRVTLERQMAADEKSAAMSEQVMTPDERMAAPSDVEEKAGIKALDFGKLFAAGAIAPTAAIPLGLESSIRNVPRQIAEQQTIAGDDGFGPLTFAKELVRVGPAQLFTNTARAFTKAATGESFAKQQENQKQNEITLDRAISKIPRVPGLSQLADAGKKTSEALSESISEAGKKAIADAQVEGNILDAIQRQSLDKLSFGNDPSFAGYALQGSQVLGSLVPIIGTAVMTKGSTKAVGTVGFGMGSGEAVQDATEYVSKLTDEQLIQSSPYFKKMVEDGVNPAEARKVVTDKAAEYAAQLQGSVAAFGGVITGKLITGQFDKLITGPVKNRLGRIALGTAAVSTEEGTQEFLEGVAKDLGINKAVIKEIGENSFANFVLGAMGGAGPGAYRGAIAKDAKETPPSQPPEPRTTIAQDLEGMDIIYPEESEYAAPIEPIEIRGVGQVPEEPAPATVAPDLEASQDLEAMLAELEDERAIDSQLKQVSVQPEVQPPVVEEVEAKEPPAEEKAPEFAKAVNVKDFSPEDKATIRAMEIDRNKIKKEKKLFPAFLRKHGVQPSEKPDLGLEGVSAPNIWKVAAPTFDELTSRAISEGFLMPTGDDVQDVENFRQYVKDYIGSGIISTGPDVAREGQLRAIDDSIQEIVSRYEKPQANLEAEARAIADQLVQIGQQGPAQAIISAIEEGKPVTPQAITYLRSKLEELSQPAPMELTGQTLDEARAAQAALETQQAEQQRVASEQQRAEQAERDRAEIARRSEGAAEDFQLGQTAEENLTGQKDIFAEPKQAYTPPKLRTDNPGGEWLKNKREQSLESGKNKFGNPSRFGSVTGYFREGSDIRKPLIPVDVLAKLQGINAEQQNVREKDLEAIKKIMDETGRLPQAPDGGDYVPFINVYQDGTAYVNEGNHRIMAAKALGFKYLPVEISYFNGAELVKDGDLSPELVTSYDMQARDDKITLDNYRGEKKAVESKTKTVTDDEGEKLSFPLFVDMADKGYKVLGFDNPRTYETKGGKKYRTVEKDGVRLAINPGEIIFADSKYPNRSPQLGYGESNQITWHFIGVDKDQRNQGKATQAIKEFMEISDKNGYTIYAEPAELEEGGMTAKQLSQFYSKFGFKPSEISDKVIIREPGAKKPRDMGSEAYPFVEPAVEKDALPMNEQQKRQAENQAQYQARYARIKEIEEMPSTPLEDVEKGFDSDDYQVAKEKYDQVDEEYTAAIKEYVRTGKDKAAFIKVKQKYENAKKQLNKAIVDGRGDEDLDADIPFNIERKQTSTPAFKKWFGDSKVVDENDKPLVVYHGTLRDFTQFNPKAKKATRGGEALRGTGAMFFTPDPELASAYTGTSKSSLTDDFFEWPPGSSKGGNVMPVYLAMKNPLVFDAETQMYSKVESVIKKAKKDGYDGVILKNIVDQPGAAGSLRTYVHNAYVVFEPTQIKSATGNIGTFDETNPDLTFNFERMASQPAAYVPEEGRTPSLRVGMNKLVRQFNEGKIAPETIMMRVENTLDSTKKEKKFKPRARGQYIIKKRINEEVGRGALMEEVVPLVEWFIAQNPALVDDLGISIQTPAEGSSTSGYYNPMARVITLMKDSGNSETAVHEILHHTERMLPEDIQAAIRKSWFSSLTKAAKKAQKGDDKNLDNYYKSLIDYHVNGNAKALQEAKRLLEQTDIDYSHYQHLNPSEFWAVNATDIVAGRFESSKSIAGRLKRWLKELYQKFKSAFKLPSSAPILRALDSLAESDGKFVSSDMIAFATDYLNRKNYKGGQAPLASWNDPEESKLDNFLYKVQDKLIDTKRVQQAITKQVGEIDDSWNAYMKEELYHGRTAKRTQDFLKNELAPIVKELDKANIDILEFDQFLHNRHAEERNVQIAKINPNMPDSGSGIATADAQQYMKDLDPAKRKLLEKLANKIDDMVKGTQKILVDSGLEEKSTIDAWNSAYKHYVPLKREDVDFVHTGTGLGQGFATRGTTSARATGSLKNVAEIFANLALQRERAIIRSEKARVGKALYGLAIKNPNPDFWLPVNPDAVKNKAKLEQELINMGLDPLDAKNLIQEPRQQYIDPRTGLVAWRVNPVLRTSDNVFPVRINGQDRFIFFNSSDERAMRMVSALKNLDADQLGAFMSTWAGITRWIASVNTQYNPVFGAWNFARDVQGAALNLSTTPLAGKQKEVVKNTFPALKAIYGNLRGDGKTTGMWADLWQDYQEAGGQTGYRDQFSRNRQQASIVEREMGAMKRGNVKKAAYAVAQWLSDYNDSMENAVRLSAYKSALDMGLSKEKAASIAKNLTVNFNRKGTWAQTAGALYAFFNASVQGTARLAETMKGPAGRKIFYGGLALGTLQAVALAAAGFDDDEPPEFIKSRNIVIPTGGKTYIAIPMPLGFNLFPNVGRLTTEFVLSGGKNPADKSIDLIGNVFNTFNPIGGTGLLVLSPTLGDPLLSVFGTNKDAFGRPISKEDRNTAPTPGYTRSRESASTINKYIAEFLNYASGGTKYQKGLVSPTADQLDYLVGQATGGVGREAMKATGAIKALATGEELPSYKVPLVGKLYGNTESPANIASKFYDNVTQLANYENEIKGRQKNRENVGQFLRDHPEARLYQRANQLENQITQINRDKKELLERKAPQKQIDVLDKRKTMLMDKFNKDYKKLAK